MPKPQNFPKTIKRTVLTSTKSPSDLQRKEDVYIDRIINFI